MVPRFYGPDEVHALAKDRAARARRPLHRGRVDGNAHGKVAVDRLRSAHAATVRGRAARGNGLAIEHVAADRRDAALKE